MYNAIKFFGSCKELLGFTRSLRATESIQEHQDAYVHKAGELPKYHEYTVDYRMRQFRACPGGWENHGQIEFVDFDSELGDELLSAMIRKGLVPNDILVNLF